MKFRIQTGILEEQNHQRSKCDFKFRFVPELFSFKFVVQSMDMMDSNDREYTNGEITVYWRPKKCIHATTCYTQLVEVFNPRKRPWVDMSGAPTQSIIDIVKKCPTDALTFQYNKDIGKEVAASKLDEAPEPVKPIEIQIMRDGPIVVYGKINLIDKDGKAYKTYSITSFCRCGASGNMPFCDGTHRKIGFQG